MEEINQKQSRILELEAYLNSTDYHILKKEEGYDILQDIITTRAAARAEVNQLEQEVVELQAEIIRETAEIEYNHEDN